MKHKLEIVNSALALMGMVELAHEGLGIGCRLINRAGRESLLAGKFGNRAGGKVLCLSRK
jgi:hypothetical protein